MILLTLFAMQGLGGMSSFPPPEEYLHFAFVHDDDDEKDLEWNIRGSSVQPTEWSESKFLDIVAQCGGKKLVLGWSLEHRIGVIARSGAKNLEMVRCVKASTSVRFSVTIKRRAYGSVSHYKRQFRELWNR